MALMGSIEREQLTEANSLAYCQLYLALAHLLRWYDLELYETTEEDMEWKDHFSPTTRGPLRFILKRVCDTSIKTLGLSITSERRTS